MAKVITVFGATGSQGSSVIRSILDHPSLSHNYRIRGVSRHVASDTARSLIEKGIDMVQADLNDASSVYEAVKGSHVVFAMTNFWESKSAAIELAQGKVVADACKALSVELLIWSTLCHATEVSNGKLSKVHHFDTKAEVEKYIRSLNIPATFVNPGCFMANLRIMLSKTHDGNYTLELPMPPSTEIPMIDAARDTGKWVTSAMLKRSEALGQHFLEADGWYTINDICDIFLKVTGKQIRFQEVSETDFAAAVGEEVCEAWLLLRDFAYFGPAAKESVGITS